MSQGASRERLDVREGKDAPGAGAMRVGCHEAPARLRVHKATGPLERHRPSSEGENMRNGGQLGSRHERRGWGKRGASGGKSLAQSAGTGGMRPPHLHRQHRPEGEAQRGCRITAAESRGSISSIRMLLLLLLLLLGKMV